MKTKISAKEYDTMVKKASPNSKILSDCACAFVARGDNMRYRSVDRRRVQGGGFFQRGRSGADECNAHIFGSVFNRNSVYDNIAKFGRAGTLVPITGFANSIVSPALEYKTEGYILGVGAKMFTIAGPVLAYGISASVIYGIIYILMKGGA